MMNKIKSVNFGKLKKQSTFLVLAFVMCLLVGGFAIYSIIFLGNNLENALAVPLPPSAPLTFDIQGFENLKLVH